MYISSSTQPMHAIGPVLHAVLGGGEYNFTFLKIILHYNMLTTNKPSDDINGSSIHKYRHGYQKWRGGQRNEEDTLQVECSYYEWHSCHTKCTKGRMVGMSKYRP